MSTRRRRQFFTPFLCGLSMTTAAGCTQTKELAFTHAEIGTVNIFRTPDSKAIAFSSQMRVNADGALGSYHPNDIGITHFCNGVSVGPAW